MTQPCVLPVPLFHAERDGSYWHTTTIVYTRRDGRVCHLYADVQVLATAGPDVAWAVGDHPAYDPDWDYSHAAITATVDDALRAAARTLRVALARAGLVPGWPGEEARRR